MRSKSSTREMLRAILSKHELNPHSEVDQTQISSEQKSLLAEFFLSRGELQLLKGEEKGLYLLETASKLEPNNPKLFYRQGLALSEFGSESGKEKKLHLACRKFRKALKIDPLFFDSWHALAQTLLQLGKKYEQHHYFLDAKIAFDKAIAFSKDQTSDVLFDVYYSYGSCLYEIGLQSEEPFDFQNAISHFQKALELKQTLPYDFWIEFGEASLELCEITSEVKFCLKAVDCFKQAIGFDPMKEDGWYLLATSLQRLFLFTHEEEHFQQANDCFAVASRLHPEKGELWLDWAELTMTFARFTKDSSKLEESLEKFQRAHRCMPDEILVLTKWSEALSLLGEMTEKLEWIHEAHNKIREAIAIDEDDIDIFLAEGYHQMSLGHYFQDLDYYDEAIIKFQTGLSIDRTSHEFWFGLANCHAILALQAQDQQLFLRASRFYVKALEIHYSSEYVYALSTLLSKFGELTRNQIYLEQAAQTMQHLMQLQKNIFSVHPDWLFQYAVTLDNIGDFHDEDTYYNKAVDLLLHMLILHPDFPGLHHRLALVYSHLGDLHGELDWFNRAVQHFRIAAKKDPDNDAVLVDWATSLLHTAHLTHDTYEAEQIFRDVEYKLLQTLKQGSVYAYYPLSCLYSLLLDYDKSLGYFKKAYDSESLPTLEEVVNDDWLEGLRSTATFREYFDTIAKKVNFQQEN